MTAVVHAVWGATAPDAAIHIIATAIVARDAMTGAETTVEVETVAGTAVLIVKAAAATENTPAEVTHAPIALITAQTATLRTATAFATDTSHCPAYAYRVCSAGCS